MNSAQRSPNCSPLAFDISPEKWCIRFKVLYLESQHSIYTHVFFKMYPRSRSLACEGIDNLALFILCISDPEQIRHNVSSLYPISISYRHRRKEIIKYKRSARSEVTRCREMSKTCHVFLKVHHPLEKEKQSGVYIEKIIVAIAV